MTLAAVIVFLAALATGCGSIPREYVRDAEWVTLTQLRTHPEQYQGKTIILGGVIVMQRAEKQRTWLLVRNRPLDQDYIPHRAAVLGGIEDGHYWIVMAPESLPRGYQHWGRITVVGKVADQPPPAVDLASTNSISTPGSGISPPAHPKPGESGSSTAHGLASPDPVLYALYLRGWSMDKAESTWEATMDPSYIPSLPSQVKRN